MKQTGSLWFIYPRPKFRLRDY